MLAWTGTDKEYKIFVIIVASAIITVTIIGQLIGKSLFGIN